MGARSFQVAIVGVGPAVALVWEVAELAATEFHHSNIRLPLGFEQALNRLLVTPRMHGIHHSIVERETNSNWSVMFSWWDRVHRTLRLDVPQRDIVIGLPAYREQHDVRLRSLLVAPFVKQRAHWRLPSGEHPDRNLGGDPRRLAA